MQITQINIAQVNTTGKYSQVYIIRVNIGNILWVNITGKHHSGKYAGKHYSGKYAGKYNSGKHHSCKYHR